MKPILTGKVRWSFDYQIQQRNRLSDLAAHVTGVVPFHAHSGEVLLTDEKIAIVGDKNLEIFLGSLEQVYLGFDQIFLPGMVKNFGLFWQPLRLTLQTGEHIYLIIDYTILGTKNQRWFNQLRAMLS